MYRLRVGCDVCDGSGWLIAGRDTKGSPFHKKCHACQRNRRNRRAVAALIVLSLGLGSLAIYLWMN